MLCDKINQIWCIEVGRVNFESTSLLKYHYCYLISFVVFEHFFESKFSHLKSKINVNYLR